MEIKKELTYLDYLNIFFIGSGGRASGDFIQPGFSVVNTTGWNQYQTMEGQENIILKFIWSSIKDNVSTGNGIIKVIIGDNIVYGKMIPQGTISIDITQYLTLGQNNIKVQIIDSYQHNVTETFLVIVKEKKTFTLSYYNGNTLLTTQTVIQGNDGSYSGSTPTKSQDAQYIYTFAGWSKDTDDGTVDVDALENITANRNVYACFAKTIIEYITDNVPYLMRKTGGDIYGN